MVAEVAPTEGESALLELWDPFFGSLSYTAVHTSLLAHRWEADVDLADARWEYYLGLPGGP